MSLCGDPTPTPTSQQPQTLLLAPRGLGGVPVGATLAEFAKTLGRSTAPMSATDRSVLADHSSVIRQLDGLPGVGFMVIGNDPEGGPPDQRRGRFGPPHR
jgi:hypothetical protein